MVFLNVQNAEIYGISTHTSPYTEDWYKITYVLVLEQNHKFTKVVVTQNYLKNPPNIISENEAVNL